MGNAHGCRGFLGSFTHRITADSLQLVTLCGCWNMFTSVRRAISFFDFDLGNFLDGFPHRG